MANIPIGTVTFLFTDLEASTRLWEEHPDAMRAVMARHDVLLQEAIQSHNGYLVKTTGDGVHAAFATATDALNAALSSQLALLAEPWPDSLPIKVRMGIHTGAAEVRQGDYFGTAVNRAARIMAAGHGGQTLLSDVVYDLCRDSLPDNVSLVSLGEHRLRDLARPETIFQVKHPALPTTFPPLKTLDNPEMPNNLPRQLTSFVGREQEIVQVKQLLAKTSLLTITGSGGCGKTRLSLQVAADLLEDFPDGVWFVELAPLSDPSLVPQAVAQVLGVKEQSGKTIQQTLIEYLSGKRLLLLLDNCEHVLAACATLADTLLRTCSHVKVLASSREGIGIAGELTYRVPSLSLPDPRQSITPDTVTLYEAVCLFIERAQFHKPDFSVTNTNAPALASVCYRLDGIPLAIELAAARIRSLSVEEINARLDSRFRLLTGGSKTALPRQQTLRALIDWSYGLLRDAEKALLCRLSVFAGGWTLPAAEAVCGFDPLEDWEVLDLLTSLVDKSLVLAQEHEGTTRYRLLETVRQYSRERLLESGEDNLIAVRVRHRDYFVAFAEEVAPRLRGPEQAHWLAALETEHDNLRTALIICLEDIDSGDIGLRLGAALWWFWNIRGYFGEGRAHLASALAREGGSSSSERLSRAGALYGAGVLSTLQGDHATANTFLQESLAIYKNLGDGQGIARLLTGLGNVACRLGDYVVAHSRLQESLAIQRELGNKHGIAICLQNLGIVAFRQRDYASARSFHEAGLALFREMGIRDGIADCLHNLSNVAHHEGDYALARALLRESLTLKRELGNKHGIANSLRELGWVAHIEGDDAAARSFIEESLTICKDLEDRMGIAISLHYLGHIALKQDDDTSARSLYQESLALWRQLEDRPGIALSLASFASLALKSEQAERAIHLWGAAASLREALGFPVPPGDRESYNQSIAQARSACGDGLFDEIWQAGKAMTMEEAIEYALNMPPG